MPNTSKKKIRCTVDVKYALLLSTRFRITRIDVIKKIIFAQNQRILATSQVNNDNGYSSISIIGVLAGTGSPNFVTTLVLLVVPLRWDIGKTSCADCSCEAFVYGLNP